jgi:catechol 2,3-dioxygenase-like lactoylglutathione lyase family enzyme
MDVLGLDHVDLTVRDVARSTAFYDTVLAELGFRRVPSSPELDVNWANAHVSIGIYEAAPEEKAAVHTRRRPGFDHLAFRAKRREDVDRFHAVLVARGSPCSIRRPSTRSTAPGTTPSSSPIRTA